MIDNICSYISLDFGDDEGMFSFPWWNEPEHAGLDESDLEFKVNVPLGLVLVVLKSDPAHVIWQYNVSLKDVK